ncbi:MAG: hypothetical protein HQ567_08005 [Candidatus Nealsonbacteria bacterium]|nr:hypothetical protein [Candidatus Nealsonbacteria bacterium]
MDNERKTCADGPAPPEPARFLWRGPLFWLPVATGLGLVAAWIAVVVQVDFGRSPLVILPLLVGVGLGAMLVGLMRLAQVGHRPTIVIGTVAIALATVASQHYIGYLKTYRWPRQNANLLVPQALSVVDFDEYMQQRAKNGLSLPWGYTARNRLAWLVWAIDGLLVLGATLSVVVPGVRLPYCNRCLSWYRVIRSGRIDVEASRALAEVVGLVVPDRAGAARYRLLACNAGCGPAGLDLSWEQPSRNTSSNRTWLNPQQHNQLTQALDKINAQQHSSPSAASNRNQRKLGD